MEPKLVIMLNNLVIAALVIAVASAENALTTCPQEAPVEPYPDCAKDLDCNWTLDIPDGIGTQACSCSSGKIFECVLTSLINPISEITVTECPNESPTTLKSSDPIPLCEVNHNLTCSWPFDIEGGTGTETCSCTSGNAFGDCTQTALGDPVWFISISSCPKTGPSKAMNSDPIPICDKYLNCSWPLAIGGGNGTEICSCAPDMGFVCQGEHINVLEAYKVTKEINSCPAEPFHSNEIMDHYTCASDFNCSWVLDVPDGAGGMDCVCVSGSVLQCSVWAVLAAYIDPSTLGGNVAVEMGGTNRVKKRSKNVAVMSMAKRKGAKKNTGEKVGRKKMDKGLRFRGC